MLDCFIERFLLLSDRPDSMARARAAWPLSPYGASRAAKFPSYCRAERAWGSALTPPGARGPVTAADPGLTLIRFLLLSSCF